MARSEAEPSAQSSFDGSRGRANRGPGGGRRRVRGDRRAAHADRAPRGPHQGWSPGGTSGSREILLAAPDAAADLGELVGGSPAELSAFREEVTRVLEEREAQERAEQRAAEMEERVKEAAESYAEYDEVDARLDETVSKLGDQLGLGVQDRRVIRDLLENQNDRNREMTRLWSSGDVDDEELGRIFMENRAAHRAEVLELIGQERLGAYQGFLRAGGLGGRFSYFTAPWENWANAKADR